MSNKLFLFLSVIIIAVSSCNKAGKSGLLVPKDAIFVIHVNTASLSSKLSWDDIRKTSWYQKANSEAHDSMAQRLLANPETSGVDTKGGFVFFMKKQGTRGYYSIQGNIKDVAAFEALVKNGDKEKPMTIEKSGDLSFARADKEAGVLTWNKSKFIFIGDVPLGDVTAAMRGGGGYNSNSEKFSTDSLLVFAKKTYGLEGSQLLDTDSKFADLIKSDGDVHFWVNPASMVNGMSGGVMSMMKISTLVEGNVSTATLSFDNGKISMNGKQFYNPELAKIFDKYPPKDISNSLLNRLPSGNVIAAMAINYPTEGLIEVLKLVGVDGLANMFLGEKGVTMDDITKAFTGEMAMGLTSIDKKSETVEYQGADGKMTSYPTTKTEPNFVFGMGVGDKTSFDKLYNLFNEMVMKEGPPKGIVIKNEKNWLVVSNQEATTNGFLAGNNKPSYTDKLKGHSFGGYLNIQQLITSFKEEAADSTSKAISDLSLKTWDDGTFSWDYKGGTGSFKMEVNMMDKNTNSLKQINSYIDQTAIINEQRKRMYENVPTIEAPVEAPPVK